MNYLLNMPSNSWERILSYYRKQLIVWNSGIYKGEESKGIHGIVSERKTATWTTRELFLIDYHQFNYYLETQRISV
ncbi:MAG: hypothetical protein ACXADY_19780 [Candidatus Hodarchaeales archaeon]|jgi:hypothetical protein